MKFSLSLITDTLFSSFISFLLFFIVVNYFMPRPYSIISSISLSIIFTVFAFKHITKKQQQVSGKKLDQKNFENAVLQLNFMNRIELIEFFEKTLLKSGYITARKRGGLVIENKNAFLFFKFGFEQASKADIVRVFNAKDNNEKGYIIAETFSEEVKNFALRFENVITVDAKTLYSFLKDNDCLPENKYQLIKPRISGLKALKSIIDRKKAKTFALYGILFLFMSYFVLLKIYYLICSTVFFILSLVCLLFGEKKTKTN